MEPGTRWWPKGAEVQRSGAEGSNRKRRSILSELGSYPRGRRTGLAPGKGGGGREGESEEEGL